MANTVTVKDRWTGRFEVVPCMTPAQTDELLAKLFAINPNLKGGV